VVQWNGVALGTTYVSPTSLNAQVPASDLAGAGTSSITVQNPAPGGGISSSLTFTINSNAATSNLSVLDLEGSDVAWDPVQQKLYVAVPSTATANASTITVVDPVAGSVGISQPLSSAASGLAISDDSHYLYAVLNGGAAIQRFILPALTPDIQWSLGNDSGTGNTLLAGDIKVQPGASQTLAVSMGQYGSGFVAIFDDGVKRSAVAGASFSDLGNSLQWKTDGSQVYAAYTVISDGPYFQSVSDDALYTMPVTNNGVGTVTKYDSAFRGEGGHLHSDPATGYVYGDWGEVVNAANGIPIGSYAYDRPNNVYAPGPLSVVDPTLKRFYTLLEVTEPDSTLAFQIQSFDQTQFHLLSTIVIPNAVGYPVNFLRWGNSGLAFVTNNGPSNTGKLYIVDGGFVNPSGTPDTTAGTMLDAVPTLTSITPLAASVGSTGLTVTVTGRDFTGQSTLYWNGIAIPTTVNGTQLIGQILSPMLSSAGLAMLTASNSGASFPASNSMPFAVSHVPPTGNQISVMNVGGNDLVWDSARARIYVSVPGVQGDSGDAIAIVDPVGGTVGTTGFLGSEPAKLSISDSGQYLYVALYGQNTVEQLTLPAFNASATWNLGGVGNFLGPYYALDLQAEPGSPQTTAIVLANFDVSPSPTALAIYDGSTPRPNSLPVVAYPFSSIQWAGSTPTLYAVDQQIPQDFLLLGVSSSGATLSQHYNGVVDPYSRGLHYDQGTELIYTDGGQVIQPLDGSIVGDFGSSGIVVPDSTLGLVFILGQTAAQVGTPNYTLVSFDQTQFSTVDSITIENVVGTPTALIRWGSNGLAFSTRVGNAFDFYGTDPGQLYLVSGNLVQPADHMKHPAVAAPLSPVRKTWNMGHGKRSPSSFGPVSRQPIR
jgi:hypothetical protein